jgi:hypothetical protein
MVVALCVKAFAYCCAHLFLCSLREVYDTLQVETSRLFQLAMSEVSTEVSEHATSITAHNIQMINAHDCCIQASKEKLQRRYEELRRFDVFDVCFVFVCLFQYLILDIRITTVHHNLPRSRNDTRGAWCRSLSLLCFVVCVVV